MAFFFRLGAGSIGWLDLIHWNHEVKIKVWHRKGLRWSQDEDWNLTKVMLNVRGAHSFSLPFWVCWSVVLTRGWWLLVSTEEGAVRCSHHGCVWVSECPSSRGTKLPPAWGTSRNQCREKEAGRLLEVLRPQCEACSSLLHPQSFGKRASWTHFMPLKRAITYKCCYIIKTWQLVTSKWWVFSLSVIQIVPPNLSFQEFLKRISGISSCIFTASLRKILW